MTGENKIVLTVTLLRCIINAYVYIITDRKTNPVSNLDRNLIRHHAVKGSDKYTTTQYKDGVYKFFEENIDVEKDGNASNDTPCYILRVSFSTHLTYYRRTKNH
ncbi:MAG: hypothetical protein IPJ13_00145 [Saprospiraceae bacterium]|nr:hypothetical protein [Saprospiraceae bacterium]